jgi:D-alanine-D-alanine ligase
LSSRRFYKVAVLMGGPSREREVSLRSGQAVANGLRESGYEAVELDVTGRSVDLPDVEAVFIALHGAFGEDGEVQQLLDDKGVPYTGSGVEGSRNSMDKELTKRILDKAGVATPAYEVLRAGETRSIRFPLVVKPAHEGSSIGLHRVEDESQWDEAFADALQYDEAVLVEEYIAGRELTCGIVDGRTFPVVEIAAPDGWYDYGAKYTKGKTEYFAPADIDEEAAGRCRELTQATFDALKCAGFGRVDFRMDAEGTLYVLEMNTIPGFTETSLLPKAAACDGVSFPELCAMIMETASCGD